MREREREGGEGEREPLPRSLQLHSGSSSREGPSVRSIARCRRRLFSPRLAWSNLSYWRRRGSVRFTGSALITRRAQLTHKKAYNHDHQIETIGQLPFSVLCSWVFGGASKKKGKYIFKLIRKASFFPPSLKIKKCGRM